MTGGAALMLAACSPSKEEADTRLVSVLLDWFPEPEHLGFFEAVHDEALEKEEIELKLLSGGPNMMAMQRVASGQVDFGTWRSDDIIVQASRGMPLVILGAYMQHDPQALMMHADSPVHDFPDLDGLPIMVGQASMWVDFIQKQYGIQFQFVPLNYSLASFMEDPDMIRQCYVTSEPFFARRQGAEVRTLLISESGFDPYRVVFTSRAYLEAHPELVAMVMRASHAGWERFVAGDYDRGLEDLTKVNDELPDGFVDYVRESLLDQGLLQGDLDQGEFLGRLDRGRLEEQVRMLYESGFITRLMEPEEFAVFDFSPQRKETK